MDVLFTIGLHVYKVTHYLRELQCCRLKRWFMPKVTITIVHIDPRDLIDKSSNYLNYNLYYNNYNLFIKFLINLLITIYYTIKLSVFALASFNLIVKLNRSTKL